MCLWTLWSATGRCTVRKNKHDHSAPAEQMLRGGFYLFLEKSQKYVLHFRKFHDKMKLIWNNNS